MVSIVIISWNSLGMLKKCLSSLDGYLNRQDVELVWVDNGSTDGAAEYVKHSYPGTKVILLPQNMGVAYARNRGVEAASGRYILFLDDDTEATVEALDILVEYMDLHPEVGIVGCALRDAQGRLQNSFKGYPGLLCKVKNVLSAKLHITALKEKCGLKSEPKLPSQVIYPTYIIGACQLLRREVFEKVGLLDEHIFYGPEDADFCIRAARKGYLTAFLPYISIRHHYRRITAKRLTTPASKAHIKALRYFWRKHHRYL
ncbi:MAG: glycosyltransferase family 2 protein [Muribaculaceae bacterium]|nr:glycosyltransferase family 2 protein [Muribaculaceae bacterium]